jgi:hypothetical protein
LNFIKNNKEAKVGIFDMKNAYYSFNAERFVLLYEQIIEQNEHLFENSELFWEVDYDFR